MLVVCILPQTDTAGFAFRSSRPERGACPWDAGAEQPGSAGRGDARQGGRETHASVWSTRFGVTSRKGLLLPASSSPEEFIWAGFVSEVFFPFFFPPAHRLFVPLIPRLWRKSHRLRTSFFNNTPHLLRHYLQAWADRHFITYLQSDYDD